MSWCEYQDRCSIYQRDRVALDKIKDISGENNSFYKILSTKLKTLCNDKHLLCPERTTLNSILEDKL